MNIQIKIKIKGSLNFGVASIIKIVLDNAYMIRLSHNIKKGLFSDQYTLNKQVKVLDIEVQVF
jgi:hypothetical protein